MSKKIDASLFRRGLKNREWDFKYIEKSKEESSLLFYKNFQIQNYITKLFNSHGLIVMMFKIEYSISCIVIKISIFDLNSKHINLTPQKTFKKFNNIINNNLIISLKNYYNVNKVSIKLKNLNKVFENNLIKSKHFKIEFKKNLSQLRVLKNNTKQLELIKLAFIIISNKNTAKLLSKFISYLLNNTKNKYSSNIFISFKNIFNVLIRSKVSKISGISILVAGRINGFPRAKKRQIKIGTLPVQSINFEIDYSKETVYTDNGTLGLKILICNKNEQNF